MIRNTHGGNRQALAARSGRDVAEILDFSANINPLGMPPVAAACWPQALAELAHYPDPDSTDLRKAIGLHLGVSPARILPGNGAEQLIWWMPKLLDARRVVVTSPCYLDYHRAAHVWCLGVVEVPLRPEQGFTLQARALADAVQAGDLVWIGQPNNPTGILNPPELLVELARSRPDVWWAVDEAFIDFAGAASSLVAAAAESANLVVVRSMTKFYAIPGLRLGYAVLSEALVDAGRGLLPDWSVSAPAQRVGVEVLREPARERFCSDTLRLIAAERPKLARALRSLGLSVWDASANYLLARLPETTAEAPQLAERLLLGHGIAVRPCGDYSGLDARYFRVAVRVGSENARLVQALEAALAA
jgi:adenosylcobyric acid synthase